MIDNMFTPERKLRFGAIRVKFAFERTKKNAGKIYNTIQQNKPKQPKLLCVCHLCDRALKTDGFTLQP